MRQRPAFHAAARALPGLVVVLCLGARPLPEALDENTDPDALLAAAVLHVRAGDVDQALVHLRESFEAGYERPSDVLKIPDLSDLARRPEPRRALRDLLHEFAGQWRVTMVTPDEPGEPLIVSGTVRGESGQPIAGALVYVYHTDTRGIYSEEGDRNPRLFAYMKTDDQGRYEYRTIRPARYPNTTVDQHVHYQVSASGYERRNVRLGFADDPLWADREPPPWTRPVSRGPDDVDHCVCDIVLTALPRAETYPADRVATIDFETQIRPIVDPRCAPCHFEGGKMYHELPFDRPETFATLGDKLFTRIKDEKEQAAITAFLRQLMAESEP